MINNVLSIVDFNQPRKAVHNLSEALYERMCLEIGTPEQIASRRDIVDIEVFLKNQVRKCDGFNRMDSGSEREGFRLQKSDIDIMYWQLDYQVIWEFSQSKCFNLNKQVLFLADSSKSPPGFTLLWLPYGRTNEDIFQFV